MSKRFHAILVALLVFIGIETWLTLGRGLWGKNAHFELLIAAILVGSIPAISRRIYLILSPLRKPSTVARIGIASLVTVASMAVFEYHAITSGRDLCPTMHDELQFLVQARMLSEGRLWSHGLALPEFFDTFYVLVTPKYAAQSFPGAALFFVPALWLGIQPWHWAVLLTGAAVGSFYLVVENLMDGIAGLLGAALLLCLPLMQFVSTMVLAQTPLILLGLFSVLLYLHWRKSSSNATAITLGFVAGLAMITRPVDALIFLIPIAASVLANMDRARIQAIAMMLCAATPWLAVQLVFDRGVTGHWLQTPFAFYNQRDQPGLGFGLHNQPGEPTTLVPEKIAYYRTAVVPRILEHRAEFLLGSLVHERFPETIDFALPHPFLCALLPLGVFGIYRRRAWPIAMGPVAFLLLYMPYPIFATHYPVVAAPGAILLVLCGVNLLARTWRFAKEGAWVACTIFCVGLLAIPPVETGPMLGAVVAHSPIMRVANDCLAQLPRTPTIVLFKRDMRLSNEYEPVYNLDSADPDQSQIIRVHDLGPRNNRLFQYYANQPTDRAVYRFDESNLEQPMTYLGNVRGLAAQP